MSQDVPVSLKKLFPGKKQKLWFWGCSPQAQGYQDIQNVGCWIKGILLCTVVFEGPGVA
jgi:hypothetical protein